jgi:hypothetical protein
MEEGIYIAEKIREWATADKGTLTDVQLAQQIAKTETGAFIRFHVSYIAMSGCAALAGVEIFVLVQGVEGCPSKSPGNQSNIGNSC